ncbi:MAG TPA: dihydrolipoamide acetyltransferase family protein [Beutenbergiaceae bacterium]|nr:dihydrolipoamide acetyltransferase family protein [Beutenbergiaceae bacterium]
MTTFRLPDLGEGLTESEIVAWQVAEGDHVELNQILAEVETAKAVVDLPSPHAGRITKLHADPGQSVAVGAPLVDFDLESAAGQPGDDGAGAPVPAEDRAPSPEQQARHPERQSVLVGYGPKADHQERPKRRARAFATVPYRGRTGADREQHTPQAMPPVRALASRLGVDLGSVAASGAGGLILRSDVEAAAAPAAADQTASTYVPVTGLRKHTAQAMTESASSAPHAAVFSTIDVTATMDLRRRASERGGADPPSFLALVCRAVILAAQQTPAANARFDAGAGQIEFFGHLNLGIAVATDRGLMVAGIPEAETLAAGALTEQIAAQAARAREGSLPLAELTNSTLTVTNVGVFDVDGGVPILNPGQSVIVALGAIRTRPWEHQGQVALREVVTVTVSFDHRVLDGAEASAFLADVTDVLSDPAIALTR